MDAGNILDARQITAQAVDVGREQGEEASVGIEWLLVSDEGVARGTEAYVLMS